MSAMKSIHDDELVLYHYRDGIDAVRMAEIEDALFADPTLRARFTRLQASLQQVDAMPALQPDAGFEQRLWSRLDARLGAAGFDAPRRSMLQRWREQLAPLLAPRTAWATAFALLLMLGVGYYAGRQSVPGARPGPGTGRAIAATEDRAVASKVLDAYVADHLRATEGLLLTASNSDSAEILAGNRDLAVSLVDSNRLYALAAMRAGKPQLASFLRQLEPVLLDLANQKPDQAIQSNEGLRDYLRKTDLLFQVRATQARLEPVAQHRA